MSNADYYRPADYQITNHYKCSSCGEETEQISIYGTGMCVCGGHFDLVGESYPSSCNDWDEERDTQDGNWHNRRQRY